MKDKESKDKSSENLEPNKWNSITVNNQELVLEPEDIQSRITFQNLKVICAKLSNKTKQSILSTMPNRERILWIDNNFNSLDLNMTIKFKREKL